MWYFPKFTAMSQSIIDYIKNARLKSCDLSLPIEKQFIRMARGNRFQGVGATTAKEIVQLGAKNL